MTCCLIEAAPPCTAAGDPVTRWIEEKRAHGESVTDHSEAILAPAAGFFAEWELECVNLAEALENRSYRPGACR